MTLDLDSLEPILLDSVISDLSWIQLPADLDETDVRLQLHEDGSYDIHTGCAQYDLDHRGYWGAGTLARERSPQDRIDLARDLIEQAFDAYAQINGAEAPEGARRAAEDHANAQDGA
jgi:hypothetical protein